jgi:GTP-binding protein Era
MLPKKCAFVALIGRPSVGKSTLVNKICGHKIAIVSKVPQTTRNAIRGIVNLEKGQLVFVDTPGRYSSDSKFNKKLMEISTRALEGCDLILYILDATRAPGKEEEKIAALLRSYSDRTIAAINKIDLLKIGNISGEAAQICNNHFKFILHSIPDLNKNNVFLISAYLGQGIDELLCALFNKAPEGDTFYENNYYTDQETNFRIAEIIREQAVNRLRQELPHSLYVDISDLELKESKLYVRAFIIVERESQKGMVVGKNGEMIKSIRLAALKELKSIFDWKINLDLRVKTGKNWRHNDNILHRITRC